ncbi:winged helix-turn-helix transcriptional regulator [Chenggangzhangella methanolivorans]|uniref:Helix-turn-helix transcriptional regulator n=1 Tax=Chenggangzhangella methanolivorans TaxID=1437009 RepID=A0A9E6R7J2_9HYPH|nr:helix-turn-helix domain-containing protein [Chenggangzhangella methanolivorans]QZN98724.1 helix-turn-helix transcriptional regulator [Chenggangzhangella methanolivorans]
MKRKSFCDDACTVARALDVIGDWWSLLIVRDVLSGKRRFGELQKSLGAAKNILAARLKRLVADGILEVSVAPGGQKDYAPTEKGLALRPVLVALGQWSAEHLFEADEPRYSVVDARDRRPLAKLELRAQDGRGLGESDVEVALCAAGLSQASSSISRRSPPDAAGSPTQSSASPGPSGASGGAE